MQKFQIKQFSKIEERSVNIFFVVENCKSYESYWIIYDVHGKTSFNPNTFTNAVNMFWAWFEKTIYEVKTYWLSAKEKFQVQLSVKKIISQYLLYVLSDSRVINFIYKLLASRGFRVYFSAITPVSGGWFCRPYTFKTID